MPLLHKKPLEKSEVPPTAQSSDKVFYVEATNEIFLNYDDFFERTIQLNSTVWSCEYTGKGGLTYFEAVESEKEALKSLGDFPEYLERPILFLVHKYTKRGRFEDLLADISLFMKTRYFIGEECLYTEGNKKQSVRVASTKLVRQWSPPAPAQDAEQSEPKEMVAAPGELYRYSIEILDSRGKVTATKEDVPPGFLTRSKASASKGKLRLFLKNATFITDEKFEVKKKYLQDGFVESLTWDQVFAGPEPLFPITLSYARRPKPGSSSTALAALSTNGVHSADSTLSLDSSPEKSSSKKKPLSEKKQKLIAEQKTELAPLFEKARKLNLDISKYEDAQKVLSKEEITKLKDLIKFAKDVYKEQAKVQRKEKIKQRYEYQKKRDDLECDDLKPFPDFALVPLPSWISDEDFGDFLAILQFFHTFAELLPLKEVRGTTKLYLTDIINAIRCNDPQNSAYAGLMKVLLTVRTEIADEEDGDEADVTTREEIQLMNIQACDPNNQKYGQEIREITVFHEEVRKIHGISVRHIPVDWMTLSEEIRLIFLTSGYYTGMATHRHRIFGRGYYKGWEDAGYVFRHAYPETMERLKTMTVFDLEPKERLEIMKVFIDQLLSFAKFRSWHDEKMSDLFERKKELRRLRNWDEQQEKEAKEARLCREHEAEEAAKEGKQPEPLKQSKETSKFKSQLRNYRESARSGKEDFEERLMTGVDFSELEMEEICQARELQKQKFKAIEQEQLDVIYKISASCGQLQIGRDRAYRNYYIVDCLPGVLVESATEYDFIGECIEKTPIADVGEYGSEEAAREAVLACTGDMASCAVHGDRKNERKRWMCIENVETLDQLIYALNKRGFRELALSEEIIYHKQLLEDVLEKVQKKMAKNFWPDIFMANGQEDPAELTNIDFNAEIRDLLLDLEDKLQQGLIGSLEPAIDRQEWRRLLADTGDVTSLIQGDVVVKSKSEEEVIYTHDELVRLNSVQKLSIAFLQLVQTIQIRFFRPPFVQPSKEDSSVNRLSGTFVRWQKSLLQCDSISAISLFLSTIEPAIMWDKSRLQGKCRLCRKKGAAESLVLCTDCDKCFHLECVHLSAPAPTQWSCAECNAEKRKKAAVEKRKATRAAALAEQMSKMEDEEEAADENSVQSSDKESTPRTNGHHKDNGVEMIQTSSGRAVKKVIYKELSGGLTPPAATNTKPLRASKRNSLPARTSTRPPKYEEDDSDFDDTSSGEQAPALRMSTRRKRKASEEPIVPVFGRAAGTSESHKEKMAALEKLVQDARRADWAWPFLEAVDTKEVVDYLDVIKNPMDLHTIMNKLKQRVYDQPEEVRDDFWLIVNNCKIYNEDGSELYECAREMEEFIKPRLDSIFEQRRSSRRH